jgi:hypothetical protein
MSTAVDWALAERVAVRVSGREPFAESYYYDSLEPDFIELTAQAEALVGETTGLRSLSGPARARLTDRAGWIAANVASFQRLLRPLIDKFGERMASRPLAPVAQKFAGAELGVMLGWMSTRVLGQYDLLIIEEESPHDQDIVYYVGPNLLTGSVVLPAKALILNVLSLTAAFGALVWIFQDGHLGAFGTTPTGTLVANMPVLLFCIAFGLSMDYEVFLLARVKEEYERTGDNDTAVSAGLQRTGRIITSAAVLIGVVFAAFATGASLDIKAMGVGLTLAILLDATVVRTLLVPATMKLMGHWNWWAPAPLRRVHERFGLHEPATVPPPTAADVTDAPPATRQPVSV